MSLSLKPCLVSFSRHPVIRLSRLVRRALAAWAFSSLVPSAATGQGAKPISMIPRCARCALEIKPLFALRTPDGDSLHRALLQSVQRVKAGGILVTYSDRRSDVELYDSSGILRHSLHRGDKGPLTEALGLLWASAVDSEPALFSGDSGVRIDLSSDLQVRDIARGPQGKFRQLVVLKDGSLVTAYVDRRPLYAGWPLKLFDKNGALVRPFGVESPYFRADSADLLRRAIAPSDDGGLWVAHVHQYVIERWDSTEHIRARYIRQPEWFSGVQLSGAVSPVDGPPSRLMSIKEDRDGNVWVIVLVPSKDWRMFLRTDSGTAGPVYSIAPLDKGYGTMVEVFNSSISRLLASTYVGAMVGFQVGDDWLVAERTATGGKTVATVYSVHLIVGNLRPGRSP